MRKAQKRELGRRRQAINREESRLSGLMAQGKAKKEREKEVQDAISARASRSKKVIPENEGNSKLAQQKRDRVEERLVRQKLDAVKQEQKKMSDEFVEMLDVQFPHDAELDLSSVDC